ncbi:MAG: N-acetylmuramoyl-L-alanine amidase [Thermodesulfobacteriota bacterium]|nr:N-acetylmuramoyl-L-alanine amidase [Thermodesulfobacteriota bacterium]
MKKLSILLLILSFICTGCLMADPAPAGTHFPDLATKRYKQSTAYYHNLPTRPGSTATRDQWLTGARSFFATYEHSPNHQQAAPALYMTARMYQQMGDRFGQKSDLTQAIHYYQELAFHFPGHRLTDDSLFETGRIYLNKFNEPDKAATIFAKIIILCPNGDMAGAASRSLRKIRQQEIVEKGITVPHKSKAKINRIRHWSTGDYTRVVIETSGPVQYKGNTLKASDGRPGRFYVDLFDSSIDKKHQDPIPIRDGLLKQVRSAQFSPNTVRVVLDTESLSGYKLFSLTEPFRVVIDVTGEKSTSGKLPTLAQQLGLEVKRVVIDPGHGGRDPGAVSFNGLLEKNVVLKVAKKVAAQLADKSGFEVILTRSTDVYIPLEERTAIANSKGADLFVSIHANSAPNKKARGIETYFLSLATSKEEMRAAARENAASARQLSDLQAILQDLMQNSKIEESSSLATAVQTQMVNGLERKYHVPDLGVKKAPFIVLIGARMPAILAEIGFISNPTEEKHLRNDRYLSDIAEQLVEGILNYSTKGMSAAL